MKDLKPINAKNKVLFNKALDSLNKYYQLNDLREKANDDDDKKAYKKYDKMCQNQFDKHLNFLYELPKYEQKIFNKL